MDPSTASEVIPPLAPEEDATPVEAPPPADEEKLAAPPAVVLEEEEAKETPAPPPHNHHQPGPAGATPAGPAAPPIGEMVGNEEETLLGVGMGEVGKVGSVPVKHDNNVVRFKDIQGYNKAKKDLAGVVDLLKDPKGTDVNARKLGGKTPRGVVIFGEIFWRYLAGFWYERKN